MNVPFFILIGFLVWLVILTGINLWILNFFRVLSKDIGRQNLIKILGTILRKQGENSAQVSGILSDLKAFKEESEFNIQKIGLIRFNPFKDMGGDHSFSLALLDGKNSGFIITTLHARERTRVYIKDIKDAGARLELSSEEKKALNQAMKSKK